MRVTQLMLIVLMSGFALAACKSKPPTLPDASNAPAETGTETNRTGDNDVSGRNLPADEQAKQAAIAAGTIIYFEYDRAEIKPEFVPIVTAHASTSTRTAATRFVSKATRTSAARASTTSASASAALRQSVAR